MDETTLMALIAEGETTSKVEFKRELHLDSAGEKAEFIKDIISLSNSAPENKGYLLVGINDAKYIVGIHSLEEERIQQLIHSHVRPSVKVICTMISTTIPSLASVGIIEVEGKNRPYRVSIPISKLKQDDIFIRHGSVVEKATPEEIRRMEDETQDFKEVARHISAAETHLELGNFQDAIDIYTKTIKSTPSAELFLRRGKIYRNRLEVNKLSDENKKELANLALKDLTTTIRLSKSIDTEKVARFERLRVSNIVYSDYEEWGEDIEWLKGKTKGLELGEVLYLEYQRYEDNVGYSYESPDEVFEAMTRTIEAGYTQPKVYQLRAQAHFSACNYGLALQDVDVALAKSTSVDERIDLFVLRANIQAKMSKFVDAYLSLSSARTLSITSHQKFWGDHLGYITGSIENEIVWRLGLEAEFGQLDKHDPSVRTAILAILTNAFETTHGQNYLDEHYAKVIRAIRKVIEKYL